MAVPDRLSGWSVQDEWVPSRPAAPARRGARQRMRLIRRRRLDLLQDGALALVLAILVLVASAGLGVVALLAIPTALVLLASLVIERRRRRPSRTARTGPAGRGPSARSARR